MGALDDVVFRSAKSVFSHKMFWLLTLKLVHWEVVFGASQSNNILVFDMGELLVTTIISKVGSYGMEFWSHISNCKMSIQLNGEYVDMVLALTRNTPQDQQLPQHYEAFDDYIFLLTFIIIFFLCFSSNIRFL